MESCINGINVCKDFVSLIGYSWYFSPDLLDLDL